MKEGGERKRNEREREETRQRIEGRRRGAEKERERMRQRVGGEGKERASERERDQFLLLNFFFDSVQSRRAKVDQK